MSIIQNLLHISRYLSSTKIHENPCKPHESIVNPEQGGTLRKSEINHTKVKGIKLKKVKKKISTSFENLMITPEDWLNNLAI